MLGPWRLTAIVKAHQQNCEVWAAEPATDACPESWHDGAAAVPHVVLKLKRNEGRGFAEAVLGGELTDADLECVDLADVFQSDVRALSSRALATSANPWYAYGVTRELTWSAMRRFTCSLADVARDAAAAAWLRDGGWRAVLRGVLRSLHVPHARGFVHRDLRQDNVMLLLAPRADGTPWWSATDVRWSGDVACVDAVAADWGLARPVAPTGYAAHPDNLVAMQVTGARLGVPHTARHDVGALLWSTGLAMQGRRHGQEPPPFNLQVLHAAALQELRCPADAEAAMLWIDATLDWARRRAMMPPALAPIIDALVALAPQPQAKATQALVDACG